MKYIIILSMKYTDFQHPLTIKIVYEKEARETPYVAYIPEFDISSCGKTEQEALKNVKEALKILYENFDHSQSDFKSAGQTGQKN